MNWYAECWERPEVAETRLLDAAKDIILHSRPAEYAHPLINFLRIALYWSTYLERVINPLDVIWMMALTKIARESHAHKEDNVVDLIGYTACYERIDRYMKSLGYSSAEALRAMTREEMAQLLERETRGRV